MNTTVSSDTFENRIEKAANVLGKTPAEVEAILNAQPYCINKENGIELLSSEEATPFGDLRNLFCEKNGIPLPKLRMAIKYLRGKSVKITTETDSALIELQTKYGIDTSLDDLDAEQLLPYYNPKRKNAVHDILEKRYGQKYGAFIAFHPDTEEVAIEETLNYLADLESGYDAEESTLVDGEPVQLYRVGQVPNEMVDEDPLALGVPLKRDRSTVNRLNWKDVPKEIRQFFRILHTRGDLGSVVRVQDRIDISSLMKKTLDELKELFPEAYIAFKNSKKAQVLPPLIISVREASNRNDPFRIGKNRSF